MSTQRNTLQRQMVLQAVQEMHNHPTAENIYLRVSRQYPSISRGTVYRNLARLAKGGEIRRVCCPGVADRFDFHRQPHHHFLCRGCSNVFDVALPYDNKLLSELPNPDGFAYEDYSITFTGLCPHCKKSRQANE